MQVKIYTRSWPIRGSFTISRGSKTQVDVVIVEVSDNGIIGRGECVPYARYHESIESVLVSINSIKKQIETGLSRENLQTLLPAGAARNAVDCALWDLECKQAGESIWDKLNAAPIPLETAYTLSLDTAKNMYESARENAHRPLLKLKLGGVGDLERVSAVRRGSPKAKIIVDANESWTAQIYQTLVPEFVKLKVAMIEQPFPAGEDDILVDLDHPIPICADESCHDRSSLSTVIGRYEMINIKTDKTGGLTEALALKAAAQTAKLDIMIGCMLASSLSMAPAFVVAQGAKIVDLDGPLLLSKDIEDKFIYQENKMLPCTAKLWG